jgi:hypothetical protein
MSDLEDRLRLLGVKRGASSLPKPTPSRQRRIQDVIEGNFISNSHGEIFITEKCIPVDFFRNRSGKFFAYNMQVITEWAIKRNSNEILPGSLCFLDTETTGLAGGSGTYTFLVGVGRFEKKHFHLVQFFMRDPSEEPALLIALENFLASCSAIVTFNGKSFDIPLLRTRYMMNCWEEPFSSLIHFDLLHLSRKLWRDILPSRTLPNIEANILSIIRTEEDIPGWMVPELYLQYLRDGDASPLKNVFYHNYMDVVSLAHLLNFLNDYLARSDGKMVEHGIEMLSLAKFYESIGNIDVAIHLYSQGIEHEDFINNQPPEKTLLDAIHKLALIHKRKNNLSLAIELLEKAVFYQSLPACIELAKIYEHRLRNIPKAIQWTNSAIQMLGNIQMPASERKELETELDHRLTRLKKKTMED